jgi:hypothetical protein
MRALACVVLVLCAWGTSARDIVDIAFELKDKEMKAEEWQDFVKATKTKYETWVNDYEDGNLKRYLDDKLLQIAPGVMGGNVKALKNMTFWVALYREFNEPPPNYLAEVSVKYQKELDDALKDFSWERTAEMIKNRKKGVVKKN